MLHPPHQLLTWILHRNPHQLLHRRHHHPHRQDPLGPHLMRRLAAPNRRIIRPNHRFLQRRRRRIHQLMRER